MPDLLPQSETTRVAWLFNCIGTPTSLLYWSRILQGYLQRFPDSWFFTARPPAKEIQGTGKSVECIGSLRIPLGRRRGSYERQIVFGSPRIISALRKIQPHVVVIQEFLSFAVYLALFRNRLDAKFLMLLESDPIRGIPWRRKRWVRAVRTLVARRMDLFLTNNLAGKQYLTDELGVPEDRIVVQPYLVSEITPVEETADGADLPELVRHDADDHAVFLYVGQLVERKGIEQLIRAIALVDPKLLGRSVFWLVGDGEQRSQLESLVRQLGLVDVVRFLGKQPHEQLATFYRAADVFVMPTLDDYRALVGFEALSYGLPLLHSIYDGAVTELVDEGRNGTQCDPRQASQFAERITWMIENVDRFGEMGQISRQRSACYTVEQAVESLHSAIERCQRT
jgi:glycosyltransferase involved in cell wall biosynthesis